MGQLAPVYSSENAIGIVLGTGNIGPRLTDNNSKKSLFLSRDGGLVWTWLRDGSHIYEIGDHGALIVIAQKGVATNYIEFSWNEGDNWEKLLISDKMIFVENVIIEPNSISQQFMVYGTYAEESDTDDDKPNKGDSAYLIYLDFSQLHEPQCHGVDVAGTPDSDYELWSPHDGRFGSNKCFLGMTKTYVRRKQDSMCYNGEEHETVTHIEPCVCSDMDYECDIGFMKEKSGDCVEQVDNSEKSGEKMDQYFLDRQNEQCLEYGYYEVS